MNGWLWVAILLALGMYVVAPILLKTGVIDGTQIIPLPIAISTIVLYSGVFAVSLFKGLGIKH